MQIRNFTYTLANGRSLFQSLSADFVDDKVNILLGPNGVGKTTLLDFIATVNKREPAYFQGFPEFKQIAYQPQGVPFIFEATVFQTMKMVMGVGGFRGKFQPTDLPETLQPLADTKYGELSGGQRRLVMINAISRLDRQLYLFDEPESGLDPKMAKRVMTEIQHLNQRGKRVIMTSHQFQNINNDQYHLLFLKAGQIRFAGSPSEFLRKEGTDNLVDAYIKQDQTVL
ncbi:AAA family ATPase [Lentilactobacillus farraginis]|uniref:ABC superfamily ATP binding cassette transporter, ABC protein n=1 Tax=Lentilactobacillus farraginis DSM 18382 = JCM 14108 TaxID=1423743 RepID=A0A0R1V8B1_9LACO|nr:AAA family ATPase [Lentilactobacillus farraginis]KRM01742.1 ABC superfamily ATP binding cassette transporter, ABC protein [Lentilactobacillus farraginis DSM 18382 = JCM 14108]